MDDIYDRFYYFLDSFDLVWFDFEVFVEVVYEKGVFFIGCWGFIDGIF